MGRDSSVGIATRYGLGGPGIKSRWGGENLRIRPPGPGAYPASYTMGTEYNPEVKLPGLGVNHVPACSAEVKESVELYLYSPSGSSWSVLTRR